MSGGSLDYISFRIDEAASQIQGELAAIKLRYDHGKYLHLSDYDKKRYAGRPEAKDEKTFTEAVIKQLNSALVCVRNAAIYTHEFEWWTSDDTGPAEFLFHSKDECKGNREAKGIV